MAASMRSIARRGLELVIAPPIPDRVRNETPPLDVEALHADPPHGTQKHRSEHVLLDLAFEAQRVVDIHGEHVLNELFRVRGSVSN